MVVHRQRLRSRGEIPTSSMADIAFLLLVFFLVTAVGTAPDAPYGRMVDVLDGLQAADAERISLQHPRGEAT